MCPLSSRVSPRDSARVHFTWASNKCLTVQRPVVALRGDYELWMGQINSDATPYRKIGVA